MSRSRKLTRQVKRHLGDDVEAAITQAGGNIPAMLQDVDAAYAGYEARLGTALRNLDICSAEMTRAQQNMEQFNRAMASILDSLGQGLLLFGRDCICSSVFSRACIDLLETNPDGKHIADVLRLGKHGRKQMESLMDVVFDSDSTVFSFDDLMKHAPRRYKHPKDLAILLDYRPMNDYKGDMTGVLVIVQDITKEEAAREELRSKEARIVRMLRIAKDKMAFVRYLRRMEEVLILPGQTRTSEEVGREIHTLKGMSRFFHLDEIANILHEMESALLSPQVSCQEVLDTCRETLAGLFDEAKSYGREIWGNNFEIQEEVITIPASYATEFGKELRAQGAQGVANRFFQKIVSQPVRDLLVPFETQLSYFSMMAELPVKMTAPESGEVRVFAAVYKNFFESLVHVARNIVDHAAEPPDIRAAAGKTPELNVLVEVGFESQFKHKMVITIADDGAGINVVRLREKLVAAGKTPEAEDKAVMQHIFDAAISTRDGVSQESGRGIGLDAVKAAAVKMGGGVHVESEPGQGTVFTMTLPVIWEPG